MPLPFLYQPPFSGLSPLFSKKFRTPSKNFMAPFYGWGSTVSKLESLRGSSLLFTTKFPEIPGTHFIDLGRMNGWVNLGATQWFWTWDPWIGNPAPEPLGHCSLNYISPLGLQWMTRNFGTMMLFRHLGKSVLLKAYTHTLRCVKLSWGSGIFVLRRSLRMLFLGPFPLAKTINYFKLKKCHKHHKGFKCEGKHN